MKSNIAISHLIRHFLVFGLTVLFLLTLIRAGLNLWQLEHIDDVQTLIYSFLQGVRFDVATVGFLLLIPVVLIPLLAMFNGTVLLARFLSPLWMLLALLVVLVLELVTPYFILSAELRPDLHTVQAVGDASDLIKEASKKLLIPAVIGMLLLLMLLYAFWVRMETNRFLRYPVKKFPALLLSIIGCLVCLLAVRSNINLNTPGLGPDAALVSAEGVINEITMNSTYKTLHDMLLDSGLLQSLTEKINLSELVSRFR